jgi:predicted  nucleic acid-binding Zn-ribbon protein
MPTTAEIFREIHRLRRYIRELEGKAEQGPRMRKVQADKLARQEEQSRQAHDAIKQLKVQIHQKEVSIKAAQELIKKYEKQLKEMITSKKEYDALTAEIAHAKQTIGQLEDEALAAIGESEDRAAKLPEVEAALKKAKDDFARFDHDFAANLERYAHEKVRAQEELKAAEATLPADARNFYDRLAGAKGADALAAVEHGNCTACYTEVTPQMASDLRRGVFLVCKSCGRILYAAQA